MAGVPLLLLLVGAEIAARLVGLDQANPAWDRFDDASGCHRPSLQLGWEATPLACGRDENGYRRGHTRTAGDDAKTLLVLGDSIADQDLWVDVVRTGLPDVQVLNSGVRGYGPCQELIIAKDAIKHVNLSLLLLQTCANDLHETPVVTTTAAGERVYRWGSTTFAVPSWLFASELTGWLAVKAAETHLAREPPLASSEVADANLACLTELTALAQSANVGLAAVAFPVLSDPENAMELYDAEQVLRLHLADLDVPQLELRRAFDLKGENAWRAMRTSPQDLLHPNERAMRKAGKATLDFVEIQLTR